jgi:hypothetical protein
VTGLGQVPRTGDADNTTAEYENAHVRKLQLQ